MRSSRMIQAAAFILTVTLSLCTYTPSLLAADQPAESSSTSIAKVNVTGNSYFELKKISLLPETSGKIAAFTITAHNEGSSEMMFIDYWVRLKSKSGNQFSARLLPQDKDKNLIAPGSSTDISFYAKVNDNTNLQDLVVQFIKWDFSEANFERIIGEVALPDSYTNVAPVDGYATMTVGGSDLHASIKKVVSNKNEKYHVPSVYVYLENAGANSVTLPAYVFSIRSSEGLMYPLEAKGVKDLVINPKEKKEIQLSGSIPIAVAHDNWQLVVTENNADLKMNLPLAFLQLPGTSGQDGGSIGQEYSFTSKSGLYTTKLNALYRLPWEDDDILTADLTLSNKGDDSLPIPNLLGYFLLDGGAKVDAKLVNTSKVIGIDSKGGVTFQLAGKIPYTNKFSQVKLVLQEKESDTVTTDLLEFSTLSELQAIPFLNQSETYTLDDAGHKSQFLIREVNSYGGNTSDIFSAQIEATNLEKRFTSLSKMVANFRSPDGTIFPATIAESKEKVGPNGKAIITAWTTLPKGYSTANMNLVLGEAVTEGKLTEGGTSETPVNPDSYVKPVAFWLPDENPAVKTILKDVELFPYTISLNRIGNSIEENNFTLKFNYEIKKDVGTQTNVDDHKIVLLFEDGGGEKSFEKSFDVKDFDPVVGEEENVDKTKLKLGKHEEFSIVLSDPDLIFKTQYLKKYSLSIYDEFQGHRKLLATQKADWFIFTD
jgi:hypothetical protein